jgi:tryptophanyl-tRNA synthetase
MTENTIKDRVLTGIRANGVPHLGNYLGAMLPMVEIQKAHGKTHDMFFFVPDLHSFTTPIDHDTLYEHTIRNLTYFIAAGMDFWAEGAHLYRQSYISAHSELTWILDCFTYFGEMRRMTQFKDKSALETTETKTVKKVLESYNLTGRLKSLGHLSENPMADIRNLFIFDRSHVAKQIVENLQKTKADTVSVGLFNYPVLMAADILLYNAAYVPVGDDQRQHLEIARDIGLRINKRFESVFPEGVFSTIPHEWDKQLAFSKRDSGVRIRSLRNPVKKMSKSVEDPTGTILMDDKPKSAVKKVMAATTDSIGRINFDWEKQPGITNLLQVLALTKDQSIQEVVTEWQGKTRYGDLKTAVAEEVEKLLIRFQKNAAQVDKTKLFKKLEQDEQEVGTIAKQTLLRAQQAVGLRPRS